jgi:hypothetical protein
MAHRKLSKMLDLGLAWRRVKKDQYNDIIPDILELRDVDYDMATTINKIKGDLDRGYRPSDLLKIDMPKKRYTLRPGSNMIPEDRIVYQAVVDFISSEVEEPPADCVFSYRLSKNNKNRRSNTMFKFWRPLWLEMKRKMRDVYANGYRCLLRTDIAAYFEHIDHRILRANVLNGQVKEKQILNLLGTLLKKWAVSDVKHIGIPQGCDASSFIGSLYLINLDKIMKREGFKYFRYSDEIYILTKDEREARKAIQSIIHELRMFHLNLQDAKTDIITDPKRVEEEIGTEEEDKRKDFDYEFQRKRKKGRIEEPEEEIVKQYNEVTRYGRAKEVELSKFKWCINRLGMVGSDRAVNFILRRLANFPFLADLCFEYLRPFANRPRVKDKITDFLTSQDNIYDWQEMWLLFTLSHASNLSDGQLDVLRGIIKGEHKHWTSRVAAILALGKLGDNADKTWLRNLYSSEHNGCVKRAIAVSVHNLPKSVRNEFYSGIKNDSPSMERLVNYLKQDEIKTM